MTRPRPSSFEDLFQRCFYDVTNPSSPTTPYDYQRRLAVDGLPDVIQVPTGSGKTASAVLPWLWRRLFVADEHVRAQTPRRLFLVLPTRALTAQTEEFVAMCLERLGLRSEVRLHVMMGGRLDREALQEWRMDLHRTTVVICTVDMYLSRALMRGYGVPRTSYPLDFALTTNGVHVVLDEVQLSPQGTTTLRQLSAFQGRLGTAEPTGLTVMSATVDHRVLDTVDNPSTDLAIVALSDADLSGPLRRRLDATRQVRRLDGVEQPGAFAAAILERHVVGTLTLVVVNTVERAVGTFRSLDQLAGDIRTLLVHSQFRGSSASATEHTSPTWLPAVE